MQFVTDRIKCICKQLSSIMHRKLAGIPMEYVPFPGYKTSNTPPESGWMPFEKDNRLRGKDVHFWFRAVLQTPPMKPLAEG